MIKAKKEFCVRDGAAGFTLLELLVTAVLVGLLSWVLLTSLGPLNRATFALRDRARASAELRLAVNYLLRDLGAADSALPKADGGLVIKRSEQAAKLAGVWSGSDPGIVYELSGELLTRFDVGNETLVAVAGGLEAFDVALQGAETQIDIVMTDDQPGEGIRLAWVY